MPYDVVTTEEAAALARGNPLSFLHVSRAEIDLPRGADPHSSAAYEKAADNFRALRARAPLVTEATPHLYVYRLQMGAHEQTGIAACFSLDEYDAGTIKKHENTRRDKEDDRTRHMLAIGAQTGPVFLTYRAQPAVSAIVDAITRRSPFFDFVADDAVRHIMWRVDAGERDALVSAFATVPALYIADGHHRAASAARARSQLTSASGAGEWDTLLGVAFPHDQVQILSYNRIVRDFGSGSLEAFLSELGGRLAVRGGSPVPSRRGEVSMFTGGRWYTIELGVAPANASAAQRLDVQRLHDLVLSPILGIGDVRTDKRIDFIGGGRGAGALEQAVASGRAVAAFSLHPVSLDELMEISDAGGMMPPKSTWFEPKLRDGLVSHVF